MIAQSDGVERVPRSQITGSLGSLEARRIVPEDTGRRSTLRKL